MQTDSYQEGSVKAARQTRVLNVRADPPDLRDRMYEPALISLAPALDNRFAGLVRDQGKEGACTGFGLAAVINLLKHLSGVEGYRTSERMLYEMARRHDEWPGEDYAGSSCRGAIRGWHNMGVCESELWPYKSDKNDGLLTIERAWNARSTTLGAYYRLRPQIADYHAALNETGAIYVSAQVHEGWSAPKKKSKTELPQIAYSEAKTGGHAFAIIGYDAQGFTVQNSWGPSWGDKGFALWSYEDWIENVMDGWVFRLALPTPQIFGLVPRSTQVTQDVEETRLRKTKRFDIAGHFVHFDDGGYQEQGDYWSTGPDVRQTAQRIAGPEGKKYSDLLIYAHGGLNSPRASARRIRALKEGFRRNGIYPYHIMYDTGLAEELKDVVKRALGFAQERAGGFTDWTDRLIEDAVRKPVTPLWEEMKRDARLPFEPDRDGTDAILAFAEALAKTDKKIHLAGHSTGGVLLGHLLKALDILGIKDLVASCSLMAPACSIEFYKQHYAPRLGRGGGKDTVVRLPKLTVYNLTDPLERDDQVAAAYRKSLLYLVSHALERADKKPLLGMEEHAKKLPKKTGLTIIYSTGEAQHANGRRTKSASQTHGGFDNDTNTMNDILKTVLGKNPSAPFTPQDMKGY